MKVNKYTKPHPLKLKQLLSLYKELADEENVPLLSGILADILSQPSLKSDQIHPNVLGYKLMGEKIYESLKENRWVR